MDYNWLCDQNRHGCETKARASRAEVQQMLIKKKQSQTYKARQEGYVVIDLETTGLNSSSDEIIELAAIRIINHKIADKLESSSKNRKRSSKSNY
ncbi:exonuclease domain-containing protein [Clostridium sp.]|uniref:exonuclease domain-containing protein n=1 Tax=Clostridium sp. TaxID=1506 RepID=UPI0035229B21